jgi:F-type H+-transporting ATPase subunit b
MLRLMLILPLLLASLAMTPAAASAADAPHGEAATHPDDHGKHAINPKEIVAPKEFGRTALWNLVLFLALLAVLSKVVWPKILGGLKAREAKIRSELTEAERSAVEARKLMAEYERKVAEAHAEARSLVEKARIDADAARQRIVAETEQDIAKLRDRARQEIDAARQQAVAELHAQTAKLAVSVAEKILSRQINAADTDRLVEQSLGELARVQSRN